MKGSRDKQESELKRKSAWEGCEIWGVIEDAEKMRGEYRWVKIEKVKRSKKWHVSQQPSFNK